MLNTVKKSIKTSVYMALFGVSLFVCSPFMAYAQYYSNNYNYNQVYVNTAGVDNVTSNSVTLNGLLNGNNLYNTYSVSTWFQYGPNTNLQYSTAMIPSNSGYANFTSNVSNLAPSTIYYYRAVAQTTWGVVYGETSSFRTNYANVPIFPIGTTIDNNYSYATTPSAVTISASGVSSTRAQLNSLIFNQYNNFTGNTWFEYGTTYNLGSSTTPVSTGSFPSVKHVNALSGLIPGTTYYFRAVVQNSSARSDGNVLNFTTSGVAYNTNTYTPTPVVTSGNDTVIKATPEETAPYATSLGASAVGAFLPGNIFGWLILIILVLVVIMLLKHPQVLGSKDEGHGASH